MNKLVQVFVAIGFLIGGLDYIIGNRYRLGERFYSGMLQMGAMAVAMVGIYSIAPYIADGTAVIFKPVAKLLHCDMSMFPSIFLCIDMGGYKAAMRVAESPEIGRFAGVLVSSSLGSAITFTLPVALSIIKKEHKVEFVRGYVIGIASLLPGCFVGGLMMGLGVRELLINLFPAFIFSAMIIGFYVVNKRVFFQTFNVLQKIITTIGVLALLYQGFSSLTGIVLLDKVIPLQEGFYVVGRIGIFIAGVFVWVDLLKAVLKKPLIKARKRTGLDEESIMCLFGGFVSNMVTFGLYDKMNKRGRLITGAHAVSAAFIFGGQLGYVAMFEPDLQITYILSRSVAAIICLFLAFAIFKPSENATN